MAVFSLKIAPKHDTRNRYPPISTVTAEMGGFSMIGGTMPVSYTHLDIKSGRIKCLVVRDLSRFGRDYIETGTYLERIFPQIGLRFIAIKEHYDNFDTDGSNESLMIPLQNMINALYSKDISRKVSTALKDVYKRQGMSVRSRMPSLPPLSIPIKEDARKSK